MSFVFINATEQSELLLGVDRWWISMVVDHDVDGDNSRSIKMNPALFDQKMLSQISQRIMTNYH